MAKIIKRHNKKIINQNPVIQQECNCRNQSTCPLDGNCQIESVVYKCITSTPNENNKTYIGLTEGTWKQRSYKHTSSFKNKKYENSTTLSKYIWKKKTENNQPPSLQWSIVTKAPAYSNISKRCLLCLNEKLAIITHPDQQNLLNIKSELISKCRHENKFTLKNYDTKD